MRAVPLVGLWLACSGPPATDGALCRDVAHRICISECGNAYNVLGLQGVADCDAELQRRAGCAGDDFMFVERSAFVSCRLPIIRAGDHVEQRPDCNDVDDMFRGCPSIQTLYSVRDGGP
jgi:hypothetical protein